jgi:hypothetical protein
MPDFHLVCVHPFHNYQKGQMITDPDEVAKHLIDREHHFVRIAIPPVVAPDVLPVEQDVVEDELQIDDPHLPSLFPKK